MHSKKLQLMLILSGALCATFIFLTVNTNKAIAADGHDHHATHEQENASDMESLMKGIGKANKKLKKQIMIPDKNKSSIEYLHVMAKNLLACTTHVPSIVPTIPSAKRSQITIDFQIEIIVALQGILEAEKQLLKNNNKAAQAAWVKVAKSMKKNHNKFQADD